MNKLGPIMIVEDDPDDQELLREAFASLNYDIEVLFCSDGFEALGYLEKSDVTPFIILSDVNMPRINGLELREKLRNSPKSTIRSIPFLLFTTGAQREAVLDAYSQSVQGFFRKPNSIKDLQDILKTIIDYWRTCYTLEMSPHPMGNMQRPTVAQSAPAQSGPLKKIAD
jgi:CheY-like chemotaxis protein